MFQVLDVLAAVRRSTPLVHCMTNTVVPEITANVLLAAGAAPAMIDLLEEAQIFAGIASALLINVGMWLERFVIVAQSLSHSFVPASWDVYRPTFWDYATFAGTIGLFLTLLLLFIRFLPMISIAEMRELVHRTEGSAAD